MATVEHPLPWRWIPYGEGRVLVDAAGNALAMGSGRVGVVIPDSHVRAVTERSRAMEKLLREIGAVSPIVECWKCNTAQIGPDGKVVYREEPGARNGLVMVPRVDGGEDFCRFDPVETGGRCPRCGRSNYAPVEQAVENLEKTLPRVRALLAEIDEESQ